jgi:peptidoglycan-associated lipoprotein
MRLHTTLIAASLLSLAACKKQVAVETYEPTPAASAQAASTDHDHKAEIAQMAANFQKVHFDYDASTLSASSKSALSANAEIMKAHPKLSVEVQGHADERGTNEYNLALGSRRAAAVRDYLVAQGVSPSRMTAISYGEEVPLAANRRAEFRITDGYAPAVAGTVD